MLRTAVLTTTVLCSASIAMIHPAKAEIDSSKLLSLSLEQLSNISVTSVSKRSEKASEAAAAIFVITQEDIRRSGMTSIPELLRMVPGLSVAQAGSHQWVVTARGTSAHFANKLLVLIDGRSVYTPLFSGVYWEVQDTMLEDIERIEVIRGPGATLWGANAVNGVINVITKSAKDTEGTLLATSFGNQEKAQVRARHGAKIGENAYMRAYAKYNDRDETKTVAGGPGRDAWNKAQGGFRADVKHSDRYSYTIQGDVYSVSASGELAVPSLAAPPTVTVYDREEAKGANILSRVKYKYAENNEVTLQAYLDMTQRKNHVIDDSRDTVDLDIQHSWLPHKDHELVWGAGYRLVSDEIKGSNAFAISKAKRTDNLFSSFVQDKITIVPNEFFVTLGSKFEHNDYTGFEVQPSGRFSWLVNDKQTLWGSVSRAVRTPNRFSDDGSLVSTFTVLPGPTSAFLGTTGNPNLESEILNAYEMGYRIQASDRLSFDLATFYNDYDKLVVGQAGTPTTINLPGLGVVPYVPVSPLNLNEAKAFGVELASKWIVNSDFDVSFGYTYFDINLDLGDPLGFEISGKTPKHQLNTLSNWRISDDVEWSNAFYFVDHLSQPNIDQYVRYDTRLAWQVLPGVEFSVVGQNLLNPKHEEFIGYVFQNNVEIPRSIYGNITWKF